MCEGEYTINISWSTEDVKQIAPDLTYAEMCKVLDYAVSEHDANWGINWDYLRDLAEIVRSER